MGAIYCPGNQAFSEMLDESYVDKTMLIEMVNACIDTYEPNFCVTRPYGFGKTYAADMLTAYYDRSCNSEALFAPLKISKSPSFRQHLNQYHVLRLDGMNYISYETNSNGKRIPKVDPVEAMRADICRALLAAYPEAGTESSDLLSILMNIVSATGSEFIVILDEWDAILREFPDDEDLKLTYILLFLRSIFKTFEASSIFAAVYMTGILPIMRCKTEYGLNNFIELTMLSPWVTADLFGFTEEEVRQYLSGTNLSFEDVAVWCEYQVDGKLVYNPLAVKTARQQGKVGDDWVRSASNEILERCICMDLENNFGLTEDLLMGNNISFSPGCFNNDLAQIEGKSCILTALVHMGFLACERMDPTTEKASIPNREIYRLFKRAIQQSTQTELCAKIERSDGILEAILSKDADKTAELITLVHAACIAREICNEREELESAVREALITAAEIYHRREVFPSGKGIAAILYLPKKYTRTSAILVELKKKRSAKSVIKQIKDGNYPECLKDYAGEILLAGITYDAKSQEHKCVIESFDMKNGTLIKP